MLPRDKKKALVRITAPDSSPLGTGFICYRAPEGVLIATCRNVVDLAAANSQRTVGIDGKHAATPVHEPAGSSVAIVQCRAMELRDREPLPLALARRFPEEARIVSYQKIRIGTEWKEEKPYLQAYELLREEPDRFELRNSDEVFRISADHYGSPVLDSDWAIGVVTQVKASPSPSSRTDALIVSESMEPLARQWLARPSDLIFDPLKARRSPIVFFSYAREDEAIVAAMAEALTQRGVTVQLDKSIIQPGDDFVAKIMGALDRADFAAFFISPDFLASKWTQDELSITIDRRNSARKPIVAIPILLSQAADRPTSLRHIAYIDLTNPSHIDRAIWEFTRVILGTREPN